MSWREHPDEEVRRTLIRLCDALCSWERSTGRQNLLVLIEQPDYDFIADCGKPIPDDGKLGMTPTDFIAAHSWHYEQDGRRIDPLDAALPGRRETNDG